MDHPEYLIIVWRYYLHARLRLRLRVRRERYRKPEKNRLYRHLSNQLVEQLISGGRQNKDALRLRRHYPLLVLKSFFPHYNLLLFAFRFLVLSKLFIQICYLYPLSQRRCRY
jgi:hypothetical protein